MKKRIYIIIVVLLYTICMTYKPIGIVIPKGARLHTDCGYQDSNTFYDITGIYMVNAKIKPFLHENKYTLRGHEIKNDYMEFKLVKGMSIILLLWGSYIPHPGTTAHSREKLGLFIGLDSMIAGDSLFFNRDSIPTIFYFDRFYDFLHQTGYTRNLDGYLFIDSIHGDTISGMINFHADTKGYYSSYDAGQRIYDTTGSWVGCDIQFKATLEKLKEDSVSIGRVDLNWYFETDSED